MDLDDSALQTDEPLHLQQLKHVAASLQASKQQTDSVTWVPQTIPAFVQQAVKKGLQAAEPPPPLSNLQDNSPTASVDHSQLDQNNFDQDAQSPTTLSAAGTTSGLLFGSRYDAAGAAKAPPAGFAADHDPAVAAAAAAATADPAAELETGPVVILGSQQCRVGGSSSGSWSKRTDWVISTCLVPDGLPTAAAAAGAGGLAALEVVCRVLVLQDCQPAAASPGLEKALAKVGWQEFGLTFKDFSTSSSSNDPTGILTLGVLQDAVVTPLALVVCSTDAVPLATAAITPEEDAAAAGEDTAAAAAAADAMDAPLAAAAASLSQAAPSSSTNSRRKRGRQGSTGTNTGPAKPAALSCRRQVAMFTVAFESALLALKAQLPAGYLQGRLEALLAATLPSVSTSLTNIITRSSNHQLRQQACSLLDCQPQGLQQSLLTKLQGAAAAALAAKSAVAARQQQREQQQQQGGGARRGKGRGAAAAAAAALVAAAGDGVGVDDDGEAEPLQDMLQSMVRPADAADRASDDRTENTGALGPAPAVMHVGEAEEGWDDVAGLGSGGDVQQQQQQQQQQQHEAGDRIWYSQSQSFRGQRQQQLQLQQVWQQQIWQQQQQQLDCQEDGMQLQSLILQQQQQQQQHTSLAGIRLCSELPSSCGDLACGEPARSAAQLPRSLIPPPAAAVAAAPPALAHAAQPAPAATGGGGAVWKGARKRRAAVLEDVLLGDEQACAGCYAAEPEPVALTAEAGAAGAAYGSVAAGRVAGEASVGGERAAGTSCMAGQQAESAAAVSAAAAAAVAAAAAAAAQEQGYQVYSRGSTAVSFGSAALVVPSFQPATHSGAAATAAGVAGQGSCIDGVGGDMPVVDGSCGAAVGFSGVLVQQWPMGRRKRLSGSAAAGLF